MVKGSKKFTLRAKTKKSRKSGKDYTILQRYLPMPEDAQAGDSLLIQIPCDSNGNVKTYKSKKANGRPFIYADIKVVSKDQSRTWSRSRNSKGRNW